ncbi:MAG TPA: hypothetical protein VFZ65_07535 [Planctomycetota bacterium]|nr:hypothetical protein [Planctomycetota bacterium]
MTKPTPQPPQIEMCLEGPAVPGRISVDTLTTVAKELQTSLRRMLASQRRGGGRFPTGIEQTCALDLTSFAEGSAVLKFEYAGQRTRDALHGDPGVRVAEEMLDAMQKAESGVAGWDSGLQAGVVDGWETLSKPLGEGVDSIRITLIDGPRKVSARLTKAFRLNLRGTNAGQRQLVDGEIEGVLWECDWKKHTGVMVEAGGNSVGLILDDRLEEQVTEYRRQRVRVRGKLERQQGRVVGVTVSEIALAAGGVAEPDPRYGGFWENLSADELARRQGVGPVDDLSKLVGDWPPEDSVDEFFEFLRKVRGG